MPLPELSEIKIRRKRLDYTQKQLAAKAEVSQSMIAKVEDGSVQPNYAIAKRLFEELEKLEGEKEISAAQLMTRQIQSCNVNKTVKEAAFLMGKHDFSQLPVMDDGKVVGSLKDKDIVEARLERGEQVFNLPVSEIMSPTFPMVDVSTRRSAILSLLRYCQAVLVTDKGKLAGIISRADLLSH